MIFILGLSLFLVLFVIGCSPDFSNIAGEAIRGNPQKQVAIGEITKADFFNAYGSFADTDLVFSKSGNSYCFSSGSQTTDTETKTPPPAINQMIVQPGIISNAWTLEGTNCPNGAYCDCQNDNECNSGFCVYRDYENLDWGKMCAPVCDDSCYEGSVDLFGRELVCRSPNKYEDASGSDPSYICALEYQSNNVCPTLTAGLPVQKEIACESVPGCQWYKNKCLGLPTDCSNPSLVAPNSIAGIWSTLRLQACEGSNPYNPDTTCSFTEVGGTGLDDICE